MDIFIDESGVDEQSGKSVVAVVYISSNNIDILNNSVIQTEKKINIKLFHWSHCSWEVRKKFSEGISKQDFTIKIAIIKNPFHATIDYEKALQHLVVERNIRNIIIDGKKSKAYQRKFKKVLRDKNISTRKLKMVSDGGYPALRIADLVAGIMRYKYENQNDAKITNLYNQISKKIIITIE